MSIAHFGLRERPFSNTPGARFVYLGAHHEKALAHLLQGVQGRGGVVHLTGEIGNGKTTVCRLLLSRLPAGVDVALILNPVPTAEEFLRTVCDELGVKYAGRAPGRTILVGALHRHLLAADADQRRTVLIVDEAQNLGVDALEELRLLTKLEVGKQRLLQIILIGPPELIDLLGRSELHRLSQSSTAGYHLLPFDEAETCAYVRHRLTQAGGARDLFEIDALREVHQLSGGVPRLINAICDRALVVAHAQRRRTVDAGTARAAAHAALHASGAHVLTVAEENRRTEGVSVAREPARPPAAPAARPFWPWLVGGGLVANALVMGAIFLVTRPSDLAVVMPPPAAVAKAEAPTVAEAPRVPPAVQTPAAEIPPLQAKLPDVAPQPDAASAPPPEPSRPARPARAQPIGPALTIAPEEPTSPVPPRARRRRPRATQGSLWSATAPPVASEQDPYAPEESTLKIEMLVWASDPKDRMVFLNGRKYVEGQALANGAVVEQIAQDGVVLVQGGQRIRLQADAR